MKRFVLFSLLASFLACGCAGHKRHNGNVEKEVSCRKKPTLGECLGWFIMGIFDYHKDEQRKIPNTNTPDPYLPPE